MSPPCSRFVPSASALAAQREGAQLSLDTVRERSSARVAALEIWFGRVDPLPLAGGITNQNFAVEDRGRRYVVRVGSDIPVHGVVRANELAASRAAHLAGLSPQSGARRARHSRARFHRGAHVHARGRTQSGEPRSPDRHGAAVSPRHSAISCAGLPSMFWVFHVVRDYGHTLLRRQQPPRCHSSTDLLARAARLEAAVGPIDVVFGHNDLLAANFIDDGQRLWLLDWEYAGFNSPLFDLGGLASNSELTPEQAERASEPLFRQARRRSHCAAVPPP